MNRHLTRSVAVAATSLAVLAATMSPTLADEPEVSEVTELSTESTPTATEPAAGESAVPATKPAGPPPTMPGSSQVSSAVGKKSTSSKPKDSTPEPPAPVKTFKQVLQGKVVLKQGDRGPGVRQLQLRLNRLGIATKVTGQFTANTTRSVKHLQWKYLMWQTGKVNAKTAQTLRNVTRPKKDAIPRYCKQQKKVLCISKNQRVLRYMVNGKVVRTLDARFGAPGYATREGRFRIFRKVRDDYSTLYRSPMPLSMYFSGGQAVHYSKYFAAVGYNGGSHGCVNIRDFKTLRWVYNRTPVGTPVYVYR